MIVGGKFFLMQSGLTRTSKRSHKDPCSLSQLNHSKRFDLKPPTPKFNFHQEVESIFELKRSVFWTEMLEMAQTQLFLICTASRQSSNDSRKETPSAFHVLSSPSFQFFHHTSLPLLSPKGLYCEMFSAALISFARWARPQNSCDWSSRIIEWLPRGWHHWRGHQNGGSRG